MPCRVIEPCSYAGAFEGEFALGCLLRRYTQTLGGHGGDDDPDHDEARG